MMKMASRLLSQGHGGGRQIARRGRCDGGRGQETGEDVRASEIRGKPCWTKEEQSPRVMKM